MLKGKTHLRKVAIWVGVIVTIPAALVIGYSIAEPFYMRFLFEGRISDFSPGDSFGVLICTWIFAVLIMIPAMFGWRRIYNNVR